MVIVFDLDDTLYPELSYVYGGYHAVADYLGSIEKTDKLSIFESLKMEEEKNRVEVFNRYLAQKKIFTKKLLNQCIRVYRSHEPSISLFHEAEQCLHRLAGFPLYVVTDGNHLVQRRKYKALGLEQWMKQCFFTYAHGLNYKKPSPYCFEKICALEKVNPAQVTYIADNPYKDFVGLKSLGFQTVRVMTGNYRYVRMPIEYEAKRQIQTLQEIDKEFLQSLQMF